jgi:hypothetical protein
MTTFLFTISIFALFFVFLGLRLLFGKDESVRGTCASQSPFLREEGAVCGFCGKPVNDCPNDKKADSKAETAPLPKIS